MDRSAELAGSCNLPVLDACLPLLVERRSTVARIGTAGPRTCPDAEVLAVGIDRIRRVLPQLLADSHQVVSVSAASAESLAMAEEPNRRLAEAGV